MGHNGEDLRGKTVRQALKKTARMNWVTVFKQHRHDARGICFSLQGSQEQHKRPMGHLRAVANELGHNSPKCKSWGARKFKNKVH
eukprot:1157687-Pelagomonas_calceolata.AAC.6